MRKPTQRIVYTVQRMAFPHNKNVKGFYRYSEAFAKARRLKGSIQIIEEVYEIYQRKTTRCDVQIVWQRVAVPS